MEEINRIFKILLICLTIGFSSQSMAQSCYATGPSMSFPGEGGVKRYSTLQGGCSDGSSLQIGVGAKPDWIIAASPTGNYSIQATASFNDSGGPRYGEISITQFGTPIGVVFVSQEAGVILVGQVSITEGPTQRCKGSGTSDFNANASNATNYSWSISNAWNSTINNSGTVSWDPDFSGTATISVTAYGANSSSSTATRNVTVTPVSTPGINIVPNEFCDGDQATLSIGPLEANVRYEILRNGNETGLSINGPGGKSWPIYEGGTYSVRATQQSGYRCSITYGEEVVIVKENVGNPVLSNPGSRCKGPGTSPISVNGGSSGNTYEWSILNAGSSTINGSGSSISIIWDPDFSGTATVRLEAEDQCGNPTIRIRTISVTEPVYWAKDTDGDGYPDPDVPRELSCSSPGADWTDDFQPLTDICPTFPNSIDGSNGCDPDCLSSVTITNQIVNFTNQGGQEQVTFNFSSTCEATGYNINIPRHPYDWLEVEPTANPNVFILKCDPGNEPKDHLVPVQVNGNTFFDGTPFPLTVRRGSAVDPDPDPDPDPCVASSMDDISFGAYGGTQSVTVNYSGDCVGTLELRNPYQPIPEWLEVTPGPGTTFILSVQENSENTEHHTILSPMMSDGNGNYMGMGVTFDVSQATCLTEWYIDTDGDGLGDFYGEPHVGCSPPENTGLTWVDNNSDQCPELGGTLANQGCPPGQLPENFNTITSTGFDVTGTMKSSSKAYFDELGKPIQNQQWNILSDDTWVSETRYDQQGRPALQTLSSPVVSGSNFVFKDGFMKRTDNTSDYTVDDFTGSNLENPNPVGNVSGTLGWYYSDANDRETYQDISDYPFVSTDYSTLNPGSVLRSYGGNKVDINQDGTDVWAQSYSFGMRASQELSQAEAFGVNDYDDDKILKSVSRDVHGVENVVFADSDGKVLAAARSGVPGTESSPLTLDILDQGYVDIHIPFGITGITVSDLASVTIYDLISEEEVTASPTTLTNSFYRVVVDDLEGYDPINNPISVTYTVNYYDYSLNEYDDVGRLTAAYQPLKDANGDRLVTTYEYDVLGQLIKVDSPDEGISEFIYRPDGQIRFSQNSEQAKVNEVSYTNYDPLGRPTESGVLESTDFTTLNGESALGANRKEQLFTTYDAIPSSVDLSGILPVAYRNPSFLSGNVAITSNDYNTTYYSYDVYGRVKWVAQDITGFAVKTIDYEYNQVTGLVDYVYFQKDVANEELIHKYTYDDAYQLTKVETSVDGGATWDVHADYDYYETGGLKRTVLADGAQAVDYIYNFSGQLKAINHPDQSTNGEVGDANDLFGMVLDYHEDDYKRTVGNINAPNYGNDLYNGNIKGVRWNLGAQPQANGDQYLYAYQYDRNNWLTEADYAIYNESNNSVDDYITDQNIYTTGTVNEVEASDYIILGTDFHAQAGSEYTARIVSAAGVNEVGNGDYDVTGISYDVNGNIQTLKRNKHNADNGIGMDDLSYVYKTDKPNQLLRVEDAEGNVVGADDIDTQSGNNYVYNDLGQLIQNVSEGVSYIYNASGLVTEVSKDGQPLVKFFYNDRNHRVKKESYSGGLLSNVSYYIRDVAGNVMAIYSDGGGMMHLAEQPVYGNGRVGVAYTASNNTKTYVYELTDHLGNVRAVFTKNGNDAQLESKMDYYPFGMLMPGRSMLGPEGYRYAFQGQEKDSETGNEAFELRLWDGRIGKWLTTDPYGQYASPYLGMGNNPISMMDLDGGFAEGCCDDDWVSNGMNELNGVTLTGMDKSASGPFQMRGFSGLPDMNFVMPKFVLGHRDSYIPKRKFFIPGQGFNGMNSTYGSYISIRPKSNALSLDFDFANPISITDTDGVKHFGRSMSMGLVTDDFGKTKFFMTVKDAIEPGIMFGAGVQSGEIYSITERPFLVSDFEGYGVESSGAYFIGYSSSTNLDVMDYAKEPTYMMHGIQLGGGIPFGIGLFRSNTNVYD